MHVEAEFRKRFVDSQSLERSVVNYAWLRRFGAPCQVPTLIGVDGLDVVFESVPGDHANVETFLTVARELGRLHRNVARSYAKHRAIMCAAPRLPDFLECRLRVLERIAPSLSKDDWVLDSRRVMDCLHWSVTRQASIYKDSNIRNFLVSRVRGVTLVDFDDVGWAPVGYDLSKLIVSMSMTFGKCSRAIVDGAISAYQDLAHVSGNLDADVVIWSEINAMFTAKYLTKNGYNHAWPAIRPWPAREITRVVRRVVS